MKIILKDFIGVKKEFLDFYKKRGIKDVGYFCASAGLPVAVAMCFILEIEPENEEAKKIKDRVNFMDTQRLFNVGDWVITKDYLWDNSDLRGPHIVHVILFDGEMIIGQEGRPTFIIHESDLELAKFVDLPIYKALTEIE